MSSTAPTSTMRPRSRQISTASCAGAADFAAAAMITQSTPRPFVSASNCSRNWLPPGNAASPPSRPASSTRSGLRSVAITNPPCRWASCATSWPTSPKPMTATFSPREIFAMRTAFSAMLPRVAKQASSKGTPSGTFTTKLAPTKMVSLWPVPSPP